MVKEGFNCRLIRKKKKQEGFSYVAPHEKLDLHKFARCKYRAKKGELGQIKSKDGKYGICLPVYRRV